MSAAESDPVVVTAFARTPLGAFQGALSPLTAPQLGAAAIRAAVKRANLPPEDVEAVLMGCVLPAGLGQAPARQAALGAGLPESAGATTINKMCGSGLKAVMIARDEIAAGSHTVMIAGGMESMSNAPYLLPKARAGMRMGHGQALDHMFLDGLEDAYDKGRLMGAFAEDCARQYGFTRQAQDEFALESLARARGTDCGDEIVPLETGKETVAADEQPAKARPEKIPALRPAFAPDGTITAANASSISDGAAALVLMRKSEAARRKIPAFAVIRAHTTHAQAPAWFSTAPVGALNKLHEKTGWKPGEDILYEINEAFAVVTMAAMRDLSLPHDIVNIRGGACALGHPIGASGARILVTLLAAMREKNVKRGMAALCIGGGEAVALAVEREE